MKNETFLFLGASNDHLVTENEEQDALSSSTATRAEKNRPNITAREKQMALELGLEEDEIDIEDLINDIEEIDRDGDVSDVSTFDMGDDNSQEQQNATEEEKGGKISISDNEKGIAEEMEEFSDDESATGIERKQSGIFFNAELYASNPELRSAMLPPLRGMPGSLPPLKQNNKQ